MKKFAKRIISTTAAAAMAVGTVFSMTASANSVSTIVCSEDVVQRTTVYVGEVVVEGETAIKYIYSPDLAYTQYSWQDLTECLGDMADKDFAAMMPVFVAEDSGDEEETESEAEAEQKKGLAVCSKEEFAEDMNSDWSSAEKVGLIYYPSMSVEDSLSVNMVDHDDGFRQRVEQKKALRAETIYNAEDEDNVIVTHLDSRTITDVYYTIEDGQVVRHSDINVVYDSEAVTVIYTRAELTESAFTPEKPAIKGDVTGDDKLDTKDAMKVISFAKKTTTPKNDTEFKAADVNNDDKIDSKDAMIVINAAKTKKPIK